MGVAETILSQIGGAGRVVAMTGAHTFLKGFKGEGVIDGLSFKMKAKGKANFVKILLTVDDLYTVEIGKVRGTTYKVVSRTEGVFAEDLKPLIERETGLYLSF